MKQIKMRKTTLKLAGVLPLFLILMIVFSMGNAATSSELRTEGVLSMDLIIDDAWIKAVDDTYAGDPDDVFLESYGDGLQTLLKLPTNKLYLPAKLHVDLEKTQLYSDPFFAPNELGGSRLFFNTSVNAVVNSNSTSITETTALSYSADYGECKATSSATIISDESLTYKTELEEDRDADGITDETGDEEWLTKINGDEWFLVHLAMASDAASTSTDNWAELQLVFKTTSGHWTYTIRLYEYAGDTDTTVGSISNGERADFYSVGASTTFEHLIFFFNLGQVVTDDSESPSIVGFDYMQHKIQIDSASASKYITMRNYNLCVYREEIGITDNVNDNSDYDYDTSGIPAYFNIDCDFPSSAITDEASTTDDTYANLLDLHKSIYYDDGRYTLLQAPFRQIYFVADTDYEIELDPSVMNINPLSPYNSSFQGYLVEMSASYDWNWLDYGGNPTSYISWTASSSKLLLEWELEYADLCYVVDTMDDPAKALYRDSATEGGYILQGIDQTAELESAWRNQADDAAITDVLLSEPSQTLGGQATTVYLKLFMSKVGLDKLALTAPSSPSPGLLAGGEPTEEEGNFILTIITAITGIVTGFFSFKWLRGYKKAKTPT